VSPYIKRLQEESESIKEQVVFTGFIDYQDMPSYLKAADVVVVPSMWEEPFGLTVLEAMAAGVPLIATRCGGIPEVCEGVSILIERENVCQNIVNAIRTIYNDPERARIMAQNAARKSRDFDKTPFAEKYFNTIYQFFPNS
jgi:glycosyltransferase involved in cell wall biosynthesis